MDGEIHEQQVEHNAMRDAAITLNGTNLCRFSNVQVMTNLSLALSEIERLLPSGRRAFLFLLDDAGLPLPSVRISNV